MTDLFQEGPLSTARLTVYAVRQARPVRGGPNVLLLGGSNFDLRQKVDFKTSPLAEIGCLATYEPRGIGRTDLPEGVWTMADYAEDALAVLDALGWDRALVVGESFGGMTALHLAVRAPERVSAMVVSSTTSGGAGGASYDIREFLGLPREVAAARALEILDTRTSSLAQAEPETYARRLAARVAFETAFARSSIAHGGYARLLDARAGHDVWAELAGIAVPTLVVAGQSDDQAPLAAQRALARRLPHATLWERPAGHGVMFADPTLLPAVLRDWLPTVLPQDSLTG